MRFTRLLVILLALACAPMFVHAAEVQMTSSTQYQWYQNFLINKGQDDVSQYLRLNLTKLDKEGKLNFYSYGRAMTQLSNHEDPLGRLYYGYLEYRDAFKDHLDLRAGRTNVNAAQFPGAWMVCILISRISAPGVHRLRRPGGDFFRTRRR